MQQFIARAICALLILSIAFTSCKKEAAITPTVDPVQKTISLGTLADRNGEFGEIDECFDILLPITFTLVGGGTYIVNDQADFDLLDSDENAPEVEDIVYPITFREKASGNLIEVNSESEMENIWKDCAFNSLLADPNAESLLSVLLISITLYPEDTGYELQYPVTMQHTVTGATTTLTDMETLQAYFEANLPIDDENFKIKLEYPLSVKETATGTITTIENKSALVEMVMKIWGEF
ncbi:MAG: hypothetical protein RIR11_4972 [Bacteroidota bacterium]|jgi:hypothetical protein